MFLRFEPRPGVEVIGRGAVLDVQVGDKDSVASGGGIVGDEDAERGLTVLALDTRDADGVHGIPRG